MSVMTWRSAKGLHEAQHAVASGHHISSGRHAAPSAQRAGVEILGKLAGIFKPFQITLGICCGKQSVVLFLMLGLLMNLCMREFNCIAAGSTAQSLLCGRAPSLPNVKDGTWAFKAAAFLSHAGLIRAVSPALFLKTGVGTISGDNKVPLKQRGRRAA